MLNTITNVLTATSSELSSLLSNVTATTSTASVGDMLFALILGVVMGFLISLVYIFTHKKSGYTQSYVMTLLMLPPIVAIVLVMINSMASALSLAGVFTLCRYRTVPGDPKDITYVFFCNGNRCDLRHQRRRTCVVCLCVLRSDRGSADSDRGAAVRHLQNQQYDTESDHSGKTQLYRTV